MKKQDLLNCAYAAKGNVILLEKLIEEPTLLPSVSCDVPYVTIEDAEYPAIFRLLAHPPIVLFYRGDLSLARASCVSVIGSRTANAYGLRMTRKLVQTLSKEFVIVSGMARGIDGCAHESALQVGRSIAVLGSGIDVVYPPEHRLLYQRLIRDHLVLSEYPPGIPPLPQHFLIRNRLIAALGQNLYVMSGQRRSGTMRTVHEALALGRTIWALPHAIDDPQGVFCNDLIAQGAMVLTNLDDLSMIY